MSLLLATLVWCAAQEPAPPPPPEDRARPGRPALTPEQREKLRKLEEDVAARLKEMGLEGRVQVGPTPTPRPPRAAEPPNPPTRRPGVEHPPVTPPMRERPGAGEDEVRQYLQEHEPETARRLRQARAEERHDEAERILQEAQGRMRGTRELKERDPKGYERMTSMRALERESFELAESLRRAPEPQRAEGVRKLDEVVGRLFDLREENRGRELEELKRRVGDLERALSGRKSSKAKIVEGRRRELLGEQRAEDW